MVEPVNAGLKTLDVSHFAAKEKGPTRSLRRGTGWWVSDALDSKPVSFGTANKDFDTTCKHSGTN